MGKCKRENKNFMIFYYCFKDELFKETFEKFPSLYFSNAELNYEFELDFNDLFYEKDNLVYFLIIFYDFPIEAQNYFLTYISRWELGTPFMKKYFFTYDYDNKYIGFYNNNKSFQNAYNKYKNQNMNSLILISIVLLILFILFGLYIIKKYVLNNKRINAIELENNNKSNINNYYSIELKSKIIFQN